MPVLLQRRQSHLSFPEHFDTLNHALNLLGSIITNVEETQPLTSEKIRHATLSLLQLPEPFYKKEFTKDGKKLHNEKVNSNVPPISTQKTKSSFIDPTLEFYSVKPKNVKELRKLIVMKEWEKGRLARWWKWHDEQLTILQNEEQRTLRRKQFLTKLSSHPWLSQEVNFPPSPTSKIAISSHEQKRLKRKMLLEKLVDGTISGPSPLSDHELQKRDSENHHTRKSALSRLRQHRPNATSIEKKTTSISKLSKESLGKPHKIMENLQHTSSSFSKKNHQENITEIINRHRQTVLKTSLNTGVLKTPSLRDEVKDAIVLEKWNENREKLLLKIEETLKNTGDLDANLLSQKDLLFYNGLKSRQQTIESVIIASID
ncbi:hypothetical protein HDU92_000609 [Lobulomyces angularis]|nr:hypothetical protein HDU92_000609 [Lobulomyces angularis]